MHTQTTYFGRPSSRARLFCGLILSTVVLANLTTAGCDGRKAATTTAAAPLKAGPESPTAQAADHDPHCADPSSCGAAAAPHELYKVPLGDSPARGGAEAKVTLVEFSDFQCPFCQRVNSTLEQLQKSYGNELKVVFKHRPLPFHGRARAAALATEAAAEQGKFWAMHDAVFANPSQLSDEDLARHAQALGLDVERWRRELRSERTQARVDGDIRLAEQLGIRGTPSFVINGRLLAGAQPLASFKTLIDEELVKAGGLLQKGTPPAQLYEELTKGGVERAAPPPSQPPATPEFSRVELGDAPVLGPADALVTIVVFSDFQCPFCARVDAGLSTLAEEYRGRVRFVWKDLPLPFHQNALSAAIAAREAKAQGKFWEMKKLLLANQSALDRTSLERYAKELGLDLGRFSAALDRQVWKSAVEADVAQAGQLGVHGTPVFFVNGMRVVGAQPAEVFRTRIDEELKRAQRLVAQGVERARVYETLMRTPRAATGNEQ